MIPLTSCVCCGGLPRSYFGSPPHTNSVLLSKDLWICVCAEGLFKNLVFENFSLTMHVLTFLPCTAWNLSKSLIGTCAGMRLYQEQEFGTDQEILWVTGTIKCSEVSPPQEGIGS